MIIVELVGAMALGFISGFLYMDSRQERMLAEVTNFNLGQINNTLRHLTVRLRRPKKKTVKSEREKTLKSIKKKLDYF